MDPTIIQQLHSIVGPEGVLTTPQALLCYSYDATIHQGRPEAVVLPTSTQQVSAIMRLATEHRIPVTPRGAGTGLSGGSLPKGGIALVLTRMNRILEIDTANLLAVVEPGVVTGVLQAEVEKAGLFYPPDPSSGRVSTIGG
ncbi:MAG: FAD-binding oxidoreductase, partial [Bacillota bacterium]